MLVAVFCRCEPGSDGMKSQRTSRAVGEDDDAQRYVSGSAVIRSRRSVNEIKG